MTPDLLSALRETPGCGEDPECIVRHALAVHHADTCAPCLTRLAEAVLAHYGPRIMEMARRKVAHPTERDYSHAGSQPLYVPQHPDWSSLLAALRSETPR